MTGRNGSYTSAQLKMIAMGTMALDHAAAGWIFGREMAELSPSLVTIGLAMRLIGRMAFPLFAFLLVQGVLYTRCWWKYALRLGGFAVLAEVPFDLVANGQMWDWSGQNTLVTLLLGVLGIRLVMWLELISEKRDQKEKNCSGNPGATGSSWGYLGITDRIMIGMVVVAIMLAAELLRADYGAMGILLMFTLYFLRYRPQERMFYSGLVLLVTYFGMFEYALAAWIAFFFINRYNGTQGRKLGYLAYAFYPAHLLIIYLTGELFYGI